MCLLMIVDLFLLMDYLRYRNLNKKTKDTDGLLTGRSFNAQTRWGYGENTQQNVNQVLDAN